MSAYSKDLRKKIVVAKERGMPTGEVARAFGVGVSSVKRYVATSREGALWPRRGAPARNPSWTKARGGSWRRTSRSAPRPPCPRGASSYRPFGADGFRGTPFLGPPAASVREPIRVILDGRPLSPRT